jgi:ABC-type dipeptide/oligopeptide/nickel transport system permease component
MEIIIASLIFTFINYMVIRASILDFLRKPFINFLKKRIVSKEKARIENFTLELIKCPFCITFWISLFLFIFSTLQFEYIFIYPVTSLLLWKMLDQPT